MTKFPVAVVIALMVLRIGLAARPWQEVPPPVQEPAPAVQRPTRPATPMPGRSMTLLAGRGELLQFDEETSRVSVSDPATADVVVVSPFEVVVNGKAPGTTTVMIWHGERVSPFNVTVLADFRDLQDQLKSRFPNEQIQVAGTRDTILLTGSVGDAETSKQVAAIAAGHAKTVTNLLQVPQTENRQVMLQVKFATIDRANMTQLGINLFSLNNGLLGTATTQQFPFPRIGQLQLSRSGDGQPELGNQQVSVSDLLNLFVFRPDINVGATLRALESRNLLEILAEPNLVTVSGREASFVAGGEFPFPVITTTGSGAQSAPVVTIQFREFGVRLSFTPTVEPNGLIHLKVRPEVSSLDFSNALTIQGFLIPAISTRRAETEVDLREGESFAIAGLMDNRVTQVVSKIPGIGDLPILGRLFRTRETRKTNTELLVLVTPTFVRPSAPGNAPPLPEFPEGLMTPAGKPKPGTPGAGAKPPGGVR